MTAPAPTALPWRVDGDEMRTIRSKASVVAVAGSMATDEGYKASERKPHVERAQADAALIVRAVNERADLIRALGYFLEDPRFHVAIGANPIAYEQMMAEVRATYDRAKEPQA